MYHKKINTWTSH